jgi:hypothetical protein
LELENGEIIERVFIDGIKEWCVATMEEDPADAFYMSEVLGSEEHETFPVKILSREHY